MRALEKDVAELLVDEHRDIPLYDDIIELTSLPRDQWNGYFTPLYETASRTGRPVTTWSRDDFDLYTWEGLQDALYELQQNPPSHLWISLPWGPTRLKGNNIRHWRRWIRNATELAYLQIQLGGEVHFEGPAESCLWKTPDKNFQYLIRHCMFSIDTDLQNFGFKEYDRQTPRKRYTTILTTDDHFRKTFRTPRMKDHSNLSLEEDKGDWQYWTPH